MSAMTDATVARIAGNLLSGCSLLSASASAEMALVALAVKRARAIVAEVARTAPDPVLPSMSPNRRREE